MTDKLMEAAKWAAARVHQLRADNERLEAENTRLLDAKGRMRVELAHAQTDNTELRHNIEALRTKILRDTAELEQLRAALGFFASVIKSGEPWTQECQRQLDRAVERKP